MESTGSSIRTARRCSADVAGGRTVAALCVALVVLGCSKSPEHVRLSNAQTPVAPETNVVVKLSADQKSALRMREAVDAEDYGEAMRIGRSLMDSQDVNVKLRVIDLFSWMGMRALPELVEFVNDADERLSDAALHSWEMALSRVDSDAAKVKYVILSIRKVRRAQYVNAMLLQLTQSDVELSRNALDSFIRESTGDFRAGCAKEMYEHLTGEIWTSNSGV